MATKSNGQIVKSSDRVKIIEDMLEEHRERLARVFHRSVNTDQFFQVVLMSLRRARQQKKAHPNKQTILDCSVPSLIGAIILAGRHGLTLDDGSGQAYLIPYSGECTFMMGYRGLMKLAYRNPRVLSVDAQAVYEGDHYVPKLGTNREIEHGPRGETDPSKLTNVYAVMELQGSQRPIVEVMTRKEVDDIRRRSRSGKSGPWVTDYVAMARKTVLRRLCNTKAPLPDDVARVVALDDKNDANLPQNLEDEWETLPGNTQPIQATAKPIQDKEPDEPPPEDPFDAPLDEGK